MSEQTSEPQESYAEGHGDDEHEEDLASVPKGPLAWMAQHSVAANVLMWLLLVGGIIIGFRTKQEVFPEFELDMVLVNVAYPGASPEEVEQSLVLAIEEAVRGLDGVKELRSTASENVAVVAIDLILGTDKNKALADVKSAVDRITSFPPDIERPVVSLAATRRQVLSVVVYGDQPESVLRDYAERARQDLVASRGVTYASLSAVRPLEVSINVPNENLRAYNLTLEQIAARVRAASVEIPAGAVKTNEGEILVRTTERRYGGLDFEDVIVISRPDGTQVRLGEIATVVDGFQEADRKASFNGKPAAMVDVYRVGDETPVSVAKVAKEYIEKMQRTAPDGISFAIWADRSEIFNDRMDLLKRNGLMGLVLVLLVLGVFLEVRLAFWVTMGIPISFLGALLFLPGLEVSINMISLFAFIVTLGIVVDDAIVVGESVFHQRTLGKSFARAAIDGVRDVATPVIFSIITTVVAFMPLLFVPGTSGKFFRNIPLVVISVLLLSLFESLLILPAHLSHESILGKAVRAVSKGLGIKNPEGIAGLLNNARKPIAHKLEWFIQTVYKRSVTFMVENRYITLAVCVALLAGSIGLVRGGRVGFVHMPKIESDNINATLEMPFGTAFERTEDVITQMLETAQEVLAESGEEGIVRGIFSQVGGTSAGFSPRGGSGSSAPNIGEVRVYLVSSEKRKITAKAFAEKWRGKIGPVPEAESLTFDYSIGAGGGSDLTVELSHTELETLERAGEDLAARLRELEGVTDINDGFAPGKRQFDFKLKPAALSLGLTEQSMARQLRSAFYGVEAVRQQRGREEIRTYVRLPRHQRDSEVDLEHFMLRTPSGGELPLGQAAFIKEGRSYTSFRRVDGRRIINVTANVEKGVTADKISSTVFEQYQPQMVVDYPGLKFARGGQQKNMAESNRALGMGFMIACICIYALLAVVFNSYAQPLIVLLAIPFGFVGALGGHLLRGFDLSLISMMGMVALAGVVVNDSLVLVVAINRFRQEGMTLFDAAIAGGVRRFRPIILTSLTTFFGLLPMIWETSVQARFLIPMALTLAFGVLFSTLVILGLVPATYLIVEDIRLLMRRDKVLLDTSKENNPAT